MCSPTPQILFHQALAAQQAGKPEAALYVLEQAINLTPRAAAFHDLRGQLLSKLGHHTEAINSAERAVRLDPKSTALRHNLGNALLAAKNFDAAAQCFRRARVLDPRDPWVHYNLGLAYAGLHQWQEAANALRAALALAPNDPSLHLSLGAALEAAGSLPEAAEHFVAVLRPQPGNETAIHRLLHALIDLNRTTDAETMLRSQQPARHDQPAAWNDLANVLICQGRLEDAASCIDRALELDPHHAFAHYNRAMIAFGAGRYGEAWPEWEWRWQRPGKKRPATGGKLWQGEPLTGKRLLVHEEEGLGDFLQFCRFVPLMAERCEVFLRVPAALERVVGTLQGRQTSYAPETTPEPACDFHLSIMSLPRMLGIELETLPTAPYLYAEPDRVAAWRERIAPLPGLRVGLAWAGNPDYSADRHRSLPADIVARLAGIPGVSFVSLQIGGADWTKLSPTQGEALNLYDPTPDLTDLAETAALIMALDLVITIDSALAHLAGALGQKVWLLNRFNTDWRWLRGREDSPWYPTMRIFTQKQPGDWAAVIDEVREALAKETHLTL